MTKSNVTISVVIPIHNESRYLPYSLRSLKVIEDDVDELVFVIDNCSDNSEDLIRNVFPGALISHLHEHKRKFLASETFQQGFDLASSDVVSDGWGLSRESGTTRDHSLPLLEPFNGFCMLSVPKLRRI